MRLGLPGVTMMSQTKLFVDAFDRARRLPQLDASGNEMRDAAGNRILIDSFGARAQHYYDVTWASTTPDQAMDEAFAESFAAYNHEILTGEYIHFSDPIGGYNSNPDPTIPYPSPPRGFIPGTILTGRASLRDYWSNWSPTLPPPHYPGP
jgi:hypothetical protein